MVMEKKTYRNDLLKILALVTMLIDHVGYALFPGFMFLRIIGRLAFPIFAYQIAIGYSKTSNLKKYTQRLLIFGLISQIPYSFFNPELQFHPLHLNVMIMFLAAMAAVYTFNLGISKITAFKQDKNFINILLAILFFLGTIAINVAPEIAEFYLNGRYGYIFSFEYGILGIAMVLAFYIFREKPLGAIIVVGVLYCLWGYYQCALIVSNGIPRLFWHNLFDFKYIWSILTMPNAFYRLPSIYINVLGFFAVIPIYLLQLIKSNKIRLNKFIGYIFYPAHITLIIIIRYITLALGR